MDHDSDSRGIGITDWDHDGDLDIWISNRTAPRLRYLENRSVNHQRFVAIRLQGTRSNRDAIGTRAELRTRTGKAQDSAKRRNVQTLSAGEGYLSQSSKWLHFGVGDDERVDALVIRWPNGQIQEFRELEIGHHYLATEGQMTLQHDPPSNEDLADTESPLPAAQSQSALAPTPITSNVRVMAHQPLPLPELDFRSVTISGQENRPAAPNSFQLITLWATWCQPCLIELREIASQQGAFRKAEIAWVALNVDAVGARDPEQLKKIQRVAANLKIAGALRLATADTLELLDVAQRVLVTKQDPIALPCSYLLDHQQRLITVYKGQVTVEQILHDVAKASSSNPDPRDYAVPYEGRWYTQPFPPDLHAIPTKLLELGRPNDAIDYLDRYLPIGQLTAGVTAQQVADSYTIAGGDLVNQKLLNRALHAFEQARQHQPQAWAPCAGLAAICEANGKYAEAIKFHRLAAVNDPENLVTLNNLAFLLAVVSDDQVRDPQEALRLAEQVCEQTDYRLPPALDTLAAAQAAVGRFAEAVATAQKAAQIAEQAGAFPVATKMRERAALYESRKPLIIEVQQP